MYTKKNDDDDDDRSQSVVDGKQSGKTDCVHSLGPHD